MTTLICDHCTRIVCEDEPTVSVIHGHGDTVSFPNKADRALTFHKDCWVEIIDLIKDKNFRPKILLKAIEEAGS